MIFLDTTTRSLQFKLGGTVSTNQLSFVASWAQLSTSGFPLNETATNTGQSNNTTAVTLVAAPSSGNIRQLKFISIRNRDTAAATVIVELNDNGTLMEIWKGTLAVDDTLFYVDADGWSVVDSTGHHKTTSGIPTIGSSTNNAIVRWSGTSGNAVKDTSNATIDDNGQLALSTTGSSGGILVGGDVQWYRDSANVWRTPDNVVIDGDLTVGGNVTLGNASTDTLTIASNAVTWSNNPTHSGNHTFIGSLTVQGELTANGNVVIGDAATDTLTVAPNTVTWSNNPTHSGNHTFSGTLTVNNTVVISANSSSSAALRITQTGPGNALVVEDSANPDSTPFVINANGFVIRGHTEAVASAGGVFCNFQSIGGGTMASYSVFVNSATAGNVGGLIMHKSSSATLGAHGAVVNGENLGIIRWAGSDGTDFQLYAMILGAVDGTPSAGVSAPGRLVFFTTPSGSTTPAEAMRLDNAKNLRVAGAAVGTSAAGVIAVTNGTAPTTGPADTVQFYSTDESAGNTIPSFYCEGTAVLATGQPDSPSSTRVKMRINGTVVTLLAI